MSWGKGIALLLASFVTMILVLVYKSTQQEFHLVTDSYYEESLDYDKVQIMKSNYSLLNDDGEVTVVREEEILNVLLPEGFEENITGTVHMYCPTDADADQRFELEQPFSISTSGFKKGKWKVIVDWEKDGKTYLFERAVFLN